MFKNQDGSTLSPFTNPLFVNSSVFGPLVTSSTTINALYRHAFQIRRGSPLLTGASFTNTRLTDAFFTQVTHRGAFGTTDWTSGWCNFDPQNTDY